MPTSHFLPELANANVRMEAYFQQSRARVIDPGFPNCF
jgi:hypothetical protein